MRASEMMDQEQCSDIAMHCSPAIAEEQVRIVACWMPPGLRGAHLHSRKGVLMLSCCLFPVAQCYIAGFRTVSSGQPCSLRSEARLLLP